jgi:dipeptidyl aminopeptidase/acylaminoacyl peptidase
MISFVLLPGILLEAQAPIAELVRIPSGGTVMFGSMFIGGGSGPRPTIILLHGNPGGLVFQRVGTAGNVLELAQPLQQAGFNVLAFNFRGAWGSGGSYSVSARIEDVRAAITFVKSLTGRFNVDPTRLMVVGHSMGGFNALFASVEEPNLTCTVGIAPANYGAKRIDRLRQSPEPSNLDDALAGVGGYTGRDLRKEVVANQPRFDVVTRMSSVRGRPLLIVQAKQDETVPADEVAAYVDAARTAGAAPLDHVLVDANHNFTLDGNRKELASAVVSWMTKYCQ